MSKIFIPENYTAKLSMYDTQKAIGLIHTIFSEELCNALNICRVSAPLFVSAASGLNDNLSGVERPVDFEVKEDGSHCQIVQSLAKWKRKALRDYDFHVGKGIYAEMNAIRRDEDLDNIHSVYVDQWDWEKVISVYDRNEQYLKSTVIAIVNAICNTDERMRQLYPSLKELTPVLRSVSFITSQELLDMYPDKTAKERENLYTKEHKTVFISKIGGPLTNGEPHDGRAPDYDDWELNGDILVWNETLGTAFELSSMGIRVSPESLDRQLTAAHCDDRRELDYHKALLAGEYPNTIGGGIGQSRLCMLLLGCAHIGEVQAAVWDDETKKACREHGIQIL